MTALAWVSRSFIINKFIPVIDDSIIAISASLLLFVLPSKNTNKPLMTWEDAVKLPWGILLLFGGGMALARGFEESGLAVWFGSQLNEFGNMHLFIVLFLIITMVNFLTEITSNLATTAMLLPVLVSLAGGIQVHPYFLLVGATLAASCAFMLPVATPPNAVVFGSGFVKIEEMVKKGIWMNLLSIVIISIFVYFILPLVWKMAPLVN
jgi:sodium-dependent dicarboxylate transporter 2/3/5